MDADVEVVRLRWLEIRIDNRSGAEKIIAIAPTGDYISISQAGLTEIKAKGTVSIKGADIVSIDCDVDVSASASIGCEFVKIQC